MKIARCARMGVIAALLAVLVSSGTGWAFVITVQVGPLDFCSDEYEDDFTDVRRDSQINSGDDLGGTEHCAVNFTGGAGSAGDTWLTRYDEPPRSMPSTNSA
jgi:hypothetical protein